MPCCRLRATSSSPVITILQISRLLQHDDSFEKTQQGFISIKRIKMPRFRFLFRKRSNLIESVVASIASSMLTGRGSNATGIVLHCFWVGL